MPAPASAQGLFGFLFGHSRHSAPQPAPSMPRVHSYADPGDPQRTDPGERSAIGGPAVAYCVRTCDGHFFPIQRMRACRRSRSASRSARRRRPRSIPAAPSPPPMRRTASAIPTCRTHSPIATRWSRTAAATARPLSASSNMDVKTDPTLRPGDIVATREGLAQVRGGRGAARAEFTPISKSALMADKKTLRIEGGARPAGRRGLKSGQFRSRPTTSLRDRERAGQPRQFDPEQMHEPGHAVLGRAPRS